LKKRLRKKLHKGEFQEMGFYVRFRLPEDLGEDDLDAFLDQFLNEAIEAHELDFGGGGHHEWQGFVALNKPGSATEEHRSQVAAWLKGHPRVLEHQLSELRDVWYDTRDWP
jgi:uncharacterized protein